MNRLLSNYRSPRVHVAGITSVLLKGGFGLKSDFLFGFLLF